MKPVGASKIYPLTDVDDNNASIANVGPGGMMSGDEYSLEGSRKGARIKARFQAKDFEVDSQTLGS